MTPLSRYQEDLKRSDFNYDPAQEEAVMALQDLFDRLVARSENPPRPDKSIFGFLKKKVR